MLYLLDANTLIDAKRDYYPISRGPEFWDWIIYQGKQGKIIKTQSAKPEQTRQDTGDRTGQGKANDKELNPEKSFWKEKDFWKKVLNIND